MMLTNTFESCKHVTLNLYMNYYKKLLDLNVLYDSFLEYKKNVDWKYSVQKYEANLLSNLYNLYKRLKNGTYKPGKPIKFTVCERGKTRNVESAPIEDKVLQRAICDYILEPILYPVLIYNNGASIKGKGVEFTRKELTKDLREYYSKYGNDGYILVGDFKNFFGSIPHDKLISSLKKYIKDEEVMNLLKMIIHSYSDTGIGVSIGSQVSQIFGVYYPTPLDRYCTIVKGCKYYARHMDDFYIIHQDKKFLKELLAEINNVANELGLILNEKKTQICKISKGFKFLKQNILLTDTGKIVKKPCKKNVVRERRKLKSFKKKLDSGEMLLSDIINHYKSWRGTTRKYATSYTIKNMDATFIDLFCEGDKEKWKKILKKNN